MSLIAIIGILAVIAIFALVTLRALLREIDHEVAREERAVLKAYNEAMVRGISRNGYIPSETTWAQHIANAEGVSVTQIAQNRRHNPRVLLIDTNGWFGTVTLPYTQDNRGATNVPLNARMMLVSSLGQPLPLVSGPTNSATFNPLWNGTNDFTAGAWAGWNGQPQDVLVERIYLTPLFASIYLSTGNSPLPGAYAFGASTMLVAPYMPMNNPLPPRYILVGTTLSLYHAYPSNTLDSVQVINKDGSYLYERCIWKSSAAGGVLPGGVDIAGVVYAFLNATPNLHAANTTPHAQVQQYMVVESMMTYMSNYIAWASGATGTTNFGDDSLYYKLRYTNQPVLINTLMGLYYDPSKNYPVNTSYCE